MSNLSTKTGGRPVAKRLRTVRLAKSCMGLQPLITDAAERLEQLERELYLLRNERDNLRDQLLYALTPPSEPAALLTFQERHALWNVLNAMPRPDATTFYYLNELFQRSAPQHPLDESGRPLTKDGI